MDQASRQVGEDAIGLACGEIVLAANISRSPENLTNILLRPTFDFVLSRTICECVVRGAVE